MKKRNLSGVLRWTIAFAFAFLASALTSLCQQGEHVIEKPFGVDPNHYLAKWDSVHRVLIFYRDTADFAVAAARAYENGTGAKLPIAPVRDFPDAKGVDVWDVSGTIDDSIVLSSVVQYGGQKVKLALLTYDRLGALQKFWEIYPYHHHKVAADREGNVYAFGHREDRGEDAGEPDYSMLIKYSPSGKILWESLPRSTFPFGQDIAETNQGTGEHSLLVGDSAILLYVATTKELFSFGSDDGKLLGRVSLSSLLKQAAAENGMTDAQVNGLSVAPAGELHSQLRLWRSGAAGDAVSFAMFRMARDGSSCKRVSAALPLPFPGTFLGSWAESRAIFLSRKPEGELVLIEQPIR